MCLWQSKRHLYVGSNDKGIYEVRLDRWSVFSIQGYSVIDLRITGNKFVLHTKGLVF
jgi:hypothetical protein